MTISMQNLIPNKISNNSNLAKHGHEKWRTWFVRNIHKNEELQYPNLTRTYIAANNNINSSVIKMNLERQKKGYRIAREVKHSSMQNKVKRNSTYWDSWMRLRKSRDKSGKITNMVGECSSSNWSCWKRWVSRLVHHVLWGLSYLTNLTKNNFFKKKNLQSKSSRKIILKLVLLIYVDIRVIKLSLIITVLNLC